MTLPKRFDGATDEFGLAAYALRGDELGEAVIESTPSGRLSDALRRVAAGIREPDANVAGLTEAESSFVAEFRATPDWVDWERVGRGALTYGRADREVIGLALGLGSLVDNYLAEPFSVVLGSTGALERMAPRRLKETAMWLEAATAADGMRPGGGGRVATAMVRLAHCRVRLRQERGSWDSKHWGRAVSQFEGLHGTLVFSHVMFRSLQQLGLPSFGDLGDSYHQWRLISHFMGVDESICPADDATARAQLEFIHRTNGRPSDNTTRLIEALLDVYRLQLQESRPRNSPKRNERFLQAVLTAFHGPVDTARIYPGAAHRSVDLTLLRTRNRVRGHQDRRTMSKPATAEFDSTALAFGVPDGNP